MIGLQINVIIIMVGVSVAPVIHGGNNKGQVLVVLAGDVVIDVDLQIVLLPFFHGAAGGQKGFFVFVQPLLRFCCMLCYELLNLGVDGLGQCAAAVHCRAGRQRWCCCLFD